MSPVERLEKRLAEVRESRIGAENAEKWTAVSTLSAAEDKLLVQLLEAQAEEAEQAAEQAAELDTAAVLDEIERMLLDLPSYLVDEVLARVERVRECADPADWTPSP